MQVTYYGHSCFGFLLNGKHVLLDPFITPNELAKDIDVESIKADYILVSHAHEDHIADVITIAQRTGAVVVGVFELVQWFKDKGVENIHPMNTGGKWEFDFGTVKLVQAVHSSTFPDGASGGCPVGFLINSEDKVFYYAGDTAVHHDMKMLGKYYSLDFAFLPIGDNFTMGIDDALVASKFIKCDKIIGMHFDTFGYIKIDHSKAIEQFESEQRKLVLMPIGSTTDL